MNQNNFNQGDLISFNVSSNADRQTLRGVVEYKDQLGFITFVDGKQYELNKLLNILVIQTENLNLCTSTIPDGTN